MPSANHLRSAIGVYWNTHLNTDKAEAQQTSNEMLCTLTYGLTGSCTHRPSQDLINLWNISAC